MSSNPNISKLVKTAHTTQKFTQQHILDLESCMDPDTGPHYFLKNFFHIQHPIKGKLVYQPFEYQNRLVDSYHQHRFNINLLPRQTGKTTTAAGYLLWFGMFIPDSTILIAAHKYTGAQEIMNRIRYAYELCPDHIRCGVTSYNKQSIEFDNGSRIVAQTTTETTGRGMSLSLLYADEFAFVPPNVAAEFWTSISPTLATGGKAIITSTPNSDEDQFAQIWKEANQKFDEFGNEQTIGKNGFFPFKAHWTEHPDRDQAWADTEKSRIGEERFRREHECVTHQSVITLQDEAGNIFTTTIGDFFDQCAKTPSFHPNLDNYKVLTPNGFRPFAGVSLMGVKPIIRLEFEQGLWIECTFDHKLYISDTEYKTAQGFEIGDTVLTSIGDIPLVNKIELDKSEAVYDLIEVEDGHRYYTNSIVSSNCEFLVFDETLISSIKLADMQGSEPVMKMGQCRWYKKINPKYTYIVAHDPSLGTGGDPAAIQIIEIPTFEQAGEWHHNLTPIQGQVRILRDICKYIADEFDAKKVTPNIYYSVENNSVGEAALVAIEEIGENSIPGLFLSEPVRKGNVRRYRKGFYTTHTSKIAICAKLKHLIESNRMKIHSKPLISELKAFVSKGLSFEGKTGQHDDLVSSVLLALRMIMLLQDWDPAIYDKMREEREDEWIMPMPIYVSSY